MKTTKMFTLVTQNDSDVSEVIDTSSESIVGLIIHTSRVLSLGDGRVIEILTNDTSYTVTVQFSCELCVRYCGIVELSIDLNDDVYSGRLLGFTEGSVRIEVVSSIDSGLPVRVGSVTYYKIDPTPFVSGESELIKPITAKVIADKSSIWPEFQFSKYSDEEFSYGVGDF